MKPFIAVIGERNSGKSTVITSLTGCPTRGFRDFIRDGATQREMLIIASSPQERRLRLADLRRLLRRAATRRRVIGCVVALQPGPTRTRLSMVGVLREAVRHRFSLHVFVLDPGYEDQGGTFPVFNLVRADLVGAGIRAAPRRLDGRRFAHLNAVRIRQMAGIP